MISYKETQFAEYSVNEKTAKYLLNIGEKYPSKILAGTSDTLPGFPRIFLLYNTPEPSYCELSPGRSRAVYERIEKQIGTVPVKEGVDILVSDEVYKRL